MPNPAAGAERLAGGVEEEAAPSGPVRRSARAWRWAGAAMFLLVIVAVFDAYLHLSKTYPENSDEANILLMANDMLHGNIFLHGWSVSDVPFISTELPQIALLVWMFGLHLNTAHIAAAVTYTLVVAVGMLLAKGHAHGWAAVARMALALAIMLAPQPGVGVFVAIFSVGHIGTALPVMLTWLVLDRLGRRWYVPLIVAVMLAWALMADPLVLVVAIYPMLAVCLVRLVSVVVAAARDGSGPRGMRQALIGRWLELSLSAAAGAAYLIAWWGGQLLSNAGGYVQQPVPYALDATRTWFWHAQVVVHGLLEMFGAYFVPWTDSFIPWPYPQHPMSGLDQAFALTRLVCVVLAVWGACAIARRMFSRDADFISQLLLAGIVANIIAYIPSTLAAHTALNTREIAPVLPFAAVLAGRMLGDRLVTGPLATIRLPGSGARNGQRRHSLGVRLVAVPLVVLFGWYSYGLFRQADTPAAPEPLTKVAAFLEARHLRYGLGGYWEASLLTVQTGGAVTVRAVTPACLQPYRWESKRDWYDPKLHSANFILLSNMPGYFSKFAVSGAALRLLNKWYGPPGYPAGWPHYLHSGGYYHVRVYPGNLLTQMPRVASALNSPAVPCG
jgi:hypothetical protein